MQELNLGSKTYLALGDLCCGNLALRCKAADCHVGEENLLPDLIGGVLVKDVNVRGSSSVLEPVCANSVFSISYRPRRTGLWKRKQ